jgi:hypothetical protein
LAPRLITATDTAFSSNRFAWIHQIHKLDLQVELKDAAPAQDASRCQPAEAGVNTSFTEGFRDDS